MGKAVHLPLWAPIHPCLPLSRKGKGTIEVMGWRFPEGHGAKHGTEITVIVSAHPGQRPARRLPRPPGLARSPLLGGSDLGGKQVGFWLAPMRPGNWALGREDCSGLWVRAGREQRGSVCVCVQSSFPRARLREERKAEREGPLPGGPGQHHHGEV